MKKAPKKTKTKGGRRGRQKNKNGHYIKTTLGKLENYIIPFFDGMSVHEINTGLIDRYRDHRMAVESPPAQSTLDKEVVAIKQVLERIVVDEEIPELL